MSNEFKVRMVLVPVVPTEKMIAAVEGDSYTFATGHEEWIGFISSDMAEEIYSNMIEAAPQPPERLMVSFEDHKVGQAALLEHIEMLKKQLQESTARVAPLQDEIDQLKALLVLANASLEGRIDDALSRVDGSEKL